MKKEIMVTKKERITQAKLEDAIATLKGVIPADYHTNIPAEQDPQKKQRIGLIRSEPTDDTMQEFKISDHQPDLPEFDKRYST